MEIGIYRAQQFPHAGRENLFEHRRAARSRTEARNPTATPTPARVASNAAGSADRQVVLAGQLRGRGEHPRLVHSARAPLAGRSRDRGAAQPGQVRVMIRYSVIYGGWGGPI